VCVYVFVCAQTADPDPPAKTNTLKATVFKFDLHVPRDSSDITAYKISENGTWPESHDPKNSLGDMHSLSAFYFGMCPSTVPRVNSFTVMDKVRASILCCTAENHWNNSPLE